MPTIEDDVARAPKGEPGRDYGMVLGTIRNSGAATGYWQPINDSAHRPTFIESVVTDDTKISVKYASLGAYGHIGMFIAVPDETLAQAGFLMGSSVGSEHADIKLSRITQTVSDHVGFSNGAWVSADGVFRCSFAGGVLTLTHPNINVDPTDRLNVTVTPRAGATGTYIAMVSAAGSAVDEKSIKIEFRDFAGNLVATPDANMRCYVTHGGGRKVAVDPRAVDDTTYPWGNIWLFGIHEMSM